MHTEIPEQTFAHLCNITSKNGEFACYVYSKKALPRELIDTYFREATHKIPSEEMWEFSSQLTELGKRLSELNVSFESPAIPLLDIKAGTYDIQRFIYWNFLKCFWKDDWGFELSKSTNFDWYAPSNAKRFSKDEFLSMINENHLEVMYFHQEEAFFINYTNLYDLIQKFYDLMGWQETQDVYLHHFADLSFNFQIGRKVDLNSFIEYYEKNQHKLAIQFPKTNDAVATPLEVVDFILLF
jgi:hypothetical protein